MKCKVFRGTGGPCSGHDPKPRQGFFQVIQNVVCLGNSFGNKTGTSAGQMLYVDNPPIRRAERDSERIGSAQVKSGERRWQEA